MTGRSVKNIIDIKTYDDFLDHLVENIIYDFERTCENNFDKDRFPDKDANYIDFKRHTAFLKMVINKRHELHDVFTLLEDEESKRIFVELIRYKVAGHKHVKLSSNTEQHWLARNSVRDLESNQSQFRYSGQFGCPELCTFIWNDQRVKLHTFKLGLAWQTHMPRRQYFLNVMV